MLISTPDMVYHEADEIEFSFSDNCSRLVQGFDLVLARRAIQDAIILRINEDADEDVLQSIVYSPLFNERIVVKFDPDGLMFFVHPLEKDAAGPYANTRYTIPIEFIEEEEDDHG